MKDSGNTAEVQYVNFMFWTSITLCDSVVDFWFLLGGWGGIFDHIHTLYILQHSVN